jgi:hypothetical protein
VAVVVDLRGGQDPIPRAIADQRRSRSWQVFHDP